LPSISLTSMKGAYEHAMFGATETQFLFPFASVNKTPYIPNTLLDIVMLVV
jgi:hypothetical protein